MIICPTITALSREDFLRQLHKIEDFAPRIHLDLMDGIFTPDRSVDINKLNKINIPCDIHLMYADPILIMEDLINHQPKTIIIQAESRVDFKKLSLKLKDYKIKSSLAILQETSVSSLKNIIPFFDQVLVFSGNLGYHGGKLDVGLIPKIGQIKAISPQVQIAWDGGINLDNIATLKDAGVEVFNVGGYIHNSPNAKKAYELLLKEIN